jgi:leader peptidase (prepilin peptidase)/N-methyltransferase
MFWGVQDIRIACSYAITASVLLAISVIDAKTLTIPNELNAFLLFVGLALNAILRDWQFTQSAILGFLCIGGFFLLVSALTNGGIGGGDIKLVAVMGLILGLTGTIASVMIGMLLFSIVGVALRKRKMAFGPYLAMGFGVGMLYGTEMLRWYYALLI